jgi:chromosome partitioning protein
MKTLTLLGQKGGSGKTTLAVHLAVAAQECAETVVVVDTDPQESAATWSRAREAETPIVTRVSASGLAMVLDIARREKMTLAVIDTAPHTAPDAAKVAALSDLAVIPCRPTAFDLVAAARSVAMVRALEVRAVFVLSACPVRAPEIAEAREELAQYGLPIYPGEISERRAFSRAISSGHAVTEFESAGKAAAEVRRLWRWLKEQMK